MNSYRSIPYRVAGNQRLTNQVPYLTPYTVNPEEERWGFLPFFGGLLLGGLFASSGNKCCGGYPNFPPPYYPQPMPTFPPQPYFYASPFNQSTTNANITTNKFYLP